MAEPNLVWFHNLCDEMTEQSHRSTLKREMKQLGGFDMAFAPRSTRARVMRSDQTNSGVASCVSIDAEEENSPNDSSATNEIVALTCYSDEYDTDDDDDEKELEDEDTEENNNSSK